MQVRRNGGVKVGAAVLIASLGLAAGVGSALAGSDGTNSSTRATADLLPAMPTSTAGAKVAVARAKVLQALKPTAFPPPGPPVNLAKVKASGKSIWLITCGGGNSYCSTVAKGAEQGAKVAGVPFKTFVSSTPNDNAVGIQQAAAQGAGAIALIAVDPRTVTAQLAAARAKGIKIISLDNTDAKKPALPGTDANVTVDFTYEGALNADYAVARNGSNINAYCMTTPEYVVTTLFCNGFKAELKLLCPNCKTSSSPYPVATIPTNVPTGLQAKLRSDPSVNVVMCGFDYLCQYAVPAIVAAGADKKVWAGTQTGQLSPNLKWVRDGHVQLADVGIPNIWKGWATIDQALRLMAGQPPAKNGAGTPVKLFTHESLAAQPASVLRTDDAAYGTKNGQVYQSVYKRLWGVK